MKNRKNKLIEAGVIIGLIITMFFMVTSTEAKLQPKMRDWQMTIDVHADGYTYCIIGEKQNASDGIDVFDVCHPPFQPPGRCFVFISQPSFPEPYNNIWMEYRHLHGVYRFWNISLLYLPLNGQGSTVNMQWNINQVLSSGYQTVLLWNNGFVANMRTASSYSFYSSPYQMTNMRIYCNNPLYPSCYIEKIM
jgi:hypothetical protein